MIKLEARDGYVYANSDRSVIGRLIYLGCHDSADNYEEISEIEAYAETENVEKMNRED